MFVFPGLGLGALAVRATKVTERMTNAASKTLARKSPTKSSRPASCSVRLAAPRVSIEVATAVAREAIREGVASFDADAVECAVRETMWEPSYVSFEPG